MISHLKSGWRRYRHRIAVLGCRARQSLGQSAEKRPDGGHRKGGKDPQTGRVGTTPLDRRLGPHGSWSRAGQRKNSSPQANGWPRWARLEVGATKDLRFAAQAACYSTRQTRTRRLRINVRLTCPPVTVRSGRGLDFLRVWPVCRPSNRRSVSLPPPSGLGAESGDEIRGVGTIWSVRQPCRGLSRLASTLGWPVRGVVQPLRWWLSGDTDAMWLDRCGEDTDRTFFHGLAERLRPPTSWRVQWIPFPKEGYNEGTTTG